MALEWREDTGDILCPGSWKADSVAVPVYDDTGMNRPYRVIPLEGGRWIAFSPSGRPKGIPAGTTTATLDDAKAWCEQIESMILAAACKEAK